ARARPGMEAGTTGRPDPESRRDRGVSVGEIDRLGRLEDDVTSGARTAGSRTQPDGAARAAGEDLAHEAEADRAGRADHEHAATTAAAAAFRDWHGHEWREGRREDRVAAVASAGAASRTGELSAAESDEVAARVQDRSHAEEVVLGIAVDERPR